MGHNSVVSGYSKSTGIPRVDELSMRPPDLGCHIMNVHSIHHLSINVSYCSIPFILMS